MEKLREKEEKNKTKTHFSNVQVLAIIWIRVIRKGLNEREN